MRSMIRSVVLNPAPFARTLLQPFRSVPAALERCGRETRHAQAEAPSPAGAQSGGGDTGWQRSNRPEEGRAWSRRAESRVDAPAGPADRTVHAMPVSLV